MKKGIIATTMALAMAFPLCGCTRGAEDHRAKCWEIVTEKLKGDVGNAPYSFSWLSAPRAEWLEIDSERYEFASYCWAWLAYGWPGYAEPMGEQAYCYFCTATKADAGYRYSVKRSGEWRPAIN